jgi:hypothetical protein
MHGFLLNASGGGAIPVVSLRAWLVLLRTTVRIESPPVLSALKRELR